MSDERYHNFCYHQVINIIITTTRLDEILRAIRDLASEQAVMKKEIASGQEMMKKEFASEQAAMKQEINEMKLEMREMKTSINSLKLNGAY